MSSQQKEVVKKLCRLCESEYKISYNLDETSGYDKYCPFCSEPISPEEDEEEESEY